jgi:beta-glucuronidase
MCRALDPSRLVTAALLTERDESEGHPVLRLADPLADAVDVLAVNTYNGWYGPDRLPTSRVSNGAYRPTAR